MIAIGVGAQSTLGGQDVSYLDFSYLGLFVPWTVRTVDCSYRLGLFVPWTIRTITGRFVPCCKTDTNEHGPYGRFLPKCACV